MKKIMPQRKNTSKRYGLYNHDQQHDACGVGFVAHIDAKPGHGIIEEALKALERMAHRGSSICGPKVPDGAGVLLPIPHNYMRSVWQPVCGNVPEQYGLGHFFLPQDEEKRVSVENLIQKVLEEHGLTSNGWRDTPVRPNTLHPHAQNCMPVIRQLMVSPISNTHSDKLMEEADFERLLYIARRHLENEIFSVQGMHPDEFHVASFSSRSIVYKGMLPGGQLAAFYSDLANRDFTAYFAIFHERYSTNTTPSWRLAQPFRSLAHNGEINTMNCNQASMVMREPLLASPLFGDNIRHISPVLDPAGSDSAMLDNALELLYHGGRSLAHSAMMLLPEPFGPSMIMGADKRAFYEYHAALMEPWDGPAALVFTDGKKKIGAMLDRNALRPCRYAITNDGLVLLASEAGVLDLPAERIRKRGRLNPRRMLMVDFMRRRVVTDAECKNRVIYSKPYRHWIRENGITLKDLPLNQSSAYSSYSEDELLIEQNLYGYCREELSDMLIPMAKNAQEPTASMGQDTPLAILSQKPQLLFSYLKQRFAQVTNPPIDPLRESLVMTLTGFAGKRGNLLEETPDHYKLLRMPNPVLSRDDILRIQNSDHPSVRVAHIPMLFNVPGFACPDTLTGGKALEKGLDELFAAADAALDDGATILLLSDADASKNRAPIASLLAVSGLHHHLVRTGRRLLCGIIVDTGEVRDVMQVAQLIGFGASGVHPRVALATVSNLARQGRISQGMTPLKARSSYATAIQKGLLKTFSRMGISTLRSFLGGQYYEALGFNQELVDRYFTGLPSRIGGIGLESIAHDTLTRHAQAYPCEKNTAPKPLVDSGKFRTRDGGEKHLWSPAAIRALHKAVKNNDYLSYREYANESDQQLLNPVTLRGRLTFKKGKSIPLGEVEPASEILKRFVGAAMSYGSISIEAHKAIATAFNRIGGKSNCGEGGELSDRLAPLPNGDSCRSRIRQVASGRFGVTASYLVNADELQIKMAQGAKPGEGGQLPAHKVLPDIARVRRTMPGVTLISPPPHHDIYSIEDLAQLIFDLKRVNDKAKVSVKLVAGTNVGTIASGVAKAGADSILISGHDGGTGAAPRSAISYVGLPWEMGLAEAHTALVCNGLRAYVRLQTDGMLRTGKDLAMATLLGAEEYGFGAGLMVALGCCMLRVCHLGTCAVGLATQDARLRAKQKGNADYVERYLRFLADDMREHMAELGFRSVDEMLGRCDMLEAAPLPEQEDLLREHPELGSNAQAWLDKIASLDYSEMLTPAPQLKSEMPVENTGPSPFADSKLEAAMLEAVEPTLSSRKPSRFEARIQNTDRSLAARLSGKVAEKYGDDGLAPGSIELVLHGTAGQSAGAFLTSGINMAIHGEANDYVGKGLSGGVISVVPEERKAELAEQEQAAIGNVALYGATAGELYVKGSAGERFAVRNSGAKAVVEGIGDHGCEYMTGGVVVVLGTTGYNFAAGMSGGLAYIYDRSESLQTNCNMDGVNISSVWKAEDVAQLRALLEKHLRHTGSDLARSILEDWQAQLPLFLKVTPLEYQKALERMKQNESDTDESMPAGEEVFFPR